MKRQSTPAVRKLYIDGVNPDSFDPNPGDKDAEPTYTEDNISEVRAKIAANTQAKKDFDGKAAENDTSWWAVPTSLLQLLQTRKRMTGVNLF